MLLGQSSEDFIHFRCKLPPLIPTAYLLQKKITKSFFDKATFGFNPFYDRALTTYIFHFSHKLQ